jgi:hypothetical protein
VTEILTPLVVAGVICAAIPALLFWVNLRIYRPARTPGPDVPRTPEVSVLIPARNEENNIVGAVEGALASRGVVVEVLVFDDRSDDATASLVEQLAERDPRVRLHSGPPLPPGWCGKEHACVLLAHFARYPLLLFVDADVRLSRDGLARLAAYQQESGADLVSGVPRQETGTLLEKLVIPLIHFILLGFLPMFWMRRSRHPAFAAGCGQLLFARQEAYDHVGGHAVIRTSLHDGITLPRAFRAAGRKTDLCDATDLATCRMYCGGRELWLGLAKNATEGLARPGLIGPATVLLLGGQVLPILLWLAFPWLTPGTMGLNALATLLLYYPRLAGIRVFRQSPLGAVLHPLGVVVLVAIQWFGLVRTVIGKPAMWKGRAYLKPGAAA